MSRKKNLDSDGDSNDVYDTRDRMNLSLISVDVPEVNPNRETMSEQEIQKKKKQRRHGRRIFRTGQAGTRTSRTRNGVKLRRGWRREAEFESIRKP